MWAVGAGFHCRGSRQNHPGNIQEAISGALDVIKARGTEPESNIQILELAV
jgi:hypothetical protein